MGPRRRSLRGGDSTQPTTSTSFDVDVVKFQAKKAAKSRKSLWFACIAWSIVATILYICTGTISSTILILIAIPISILSVISILSFTIGKPFTARFSSFFIPRGMKSIDAMFADVRSELLKNVHGVVLDVGCGDGPYLKYYAKSHHLKKVVFLEPNVFQHPLLNLNIARMIQQHPETLGKVCNHPLLLTYTLTPSHKSSDVLSIAPSHTPSSIYCLYQHTQGFIYMSLNIDS